jgi:ABC-type glycerol-3-phosphate transport system substrate-binding protein
VFEKMNSTQHNWNPPSGPTRRTILKAAAGFGGAAAAAMALSACGSGSSSSAAKPKTGKATLTNVEHDTRPLDRAAYAAVYQAFRAKNPDIELKFTEIPWEQARSKMLTLGQGNSLPNVGRMAWPADYAAAGMVLPLDDRVKPEVLARYDQMAIDQYSTQGDDGKVHLFGLPWFAGATAVMVNKTMLDKAGVKLGATWTTAEFQDICKAVTQTGKQWGVTLDGNGIGDPVQIFLMAVYAYGGKWVAGDTKSTTPEPLVFDSPETVEGIKWYLNLYKSGVAVPSAPSDTYQQRDANFIAGKAAIAWQGPWNITATQATFKKNGFDLVSMPLPTGPAGNTSVYGGGAAGIFKSSQKQGVVDQAFTWIDFLGSDEGEKLYCKANGMIPASKAARSDAYWSANPLYQGYLKAMESTPLMFPVWATGLESLLDTIVPPLLQGAFNGQVSEQDMAKKIQEQVVKGLQKNGVKTANS